MRESKRVITFFVWENMYRMGENRKFIVRGWRLEESK